MVCIQAFQAQKSYRKLHPRYFPPYNFTPATSPRTALPLTTSPQCQLYPWQLQPQQLHSFTQVVNRGKVSGGEVVRGESVGGETAGVKLPGVKYLDIVKRAFTISKSLILSSTLPWKSLVLSLNTPHLNYYAKTWIQNAEINFRFWLSGKLWTTRKSLQCYNL